MERSDGMGPAEDQCGMSREGTRNEFKGAGQFLAGPRKASDQWCQRSIVGRSSEPAAHWAVDGGHSSDNQRRRAQCAASWQ